MDLVKKNIIIALAVISVLLVIFVACGHKNNDTDTPTAKATETQDKEYVMEHEFVFSEHMSEQLHSFSDYPVGEEKFYELTGGIEVIEGLGKYGYMLEGNNHSDDLFMYITVPVEMRPNTTYNYKMTFNIATSVAGDMMGVGGSPGASVFVKAGAVSIKPESTEEDGYYRINIDKGNQGLGGKDLINAGNIEKEDGSPDGVFATKIFGAYGDVTTGDDGIVYLVVGTDSGFEGKTTVYIEDLKVVFE